MLGRNILVAPVFNKKAAKRDVFLPGNEKWVELWTRKTYENADSQTLSIDADMGFPPVFFRDAPDFDAMAMAELLDPSTGFLFTQ